MKNWIAEFTAKQNQLPEGEETVRLLVNAHYKREAVIKAREKLKKMDPENHKKYRAPDVRKIDAVTEEEKEDVEQIDLELNQKTDGHTLQEIESLITGEQTPHVDEPDPIQTQIDELNVRLNELLPQEVLVLDNLPNEVYHGCNGDSSTKIKDACQSMMYYNACYNTQTVKKPRGDHFDVGNLAHALILEPDTVESAYKKKPKTPQPTEPQRKKYDAWVKLGRPSEDEDPKAQPTPLAIERCEFWDNFKAQNKHYVIVDDDNWKIAQGMADAVNNHEIAKIILNNDHRKSERSYFTREAHTGRIIKVRTDIDLGSIIADVKTISLRRKVDGEYIRNILRHEINQRKYDLSAAMYLDVTGAKQFVWIFVNKEVGYHWVAVIRASEETIEEGRAVYLEKLQEIQHCQEVNVWPEPVSIQRVFNPETEQFEIPTI